jgi:hypothetical protein
MDQIETQQREGPNPVTSEKTTLRKSIWELLNTPFVLFVMTSLVLGGLSFFYQEYSSYRNKTENRNNQISHLTTEIKYRLDLLSAMVLPEFTFTAKFTAHGALFGESRNKTPKDVLIGEYSPIYPEFSNRNLISLLWERQELTKGAAKAFPLRQSIDAFHRLVAILDDGVERSEAMVEGKRDSIWRFKSQSVEDEFDKISD